MSTPSHPALSLTAADIAATVASIRRSLISTGASSVVLDAYTWLLVQSVMDYANAAAAAAIAAQLSDPHPSPERD